MRFRVICLEAVFSFSIYNNELLKYEVLYILPSLARTAVLFVQVLRTLKIVQSPRYNGRDCTCQGKQLELVS